MGCMPLLVDISHPIEKYDVCRQKTTHRPVGKNSPRTKPKAIPISYKKGLVSLTAHRSEKHGSKLLFGGRRSSGGSGLDIQLIECAIPYTYRNLSVCDQKPRGLFVMQYFSEQLRVFLKTWLNLWFNSAQIQIHI